jgi:Tfp pilus assembly protein PilN
MRRLVCEKLSVRIEDVMVDYHAQGGGPSKPSHRGKDAKDAPPPGPVEVFGIAALRSVLDSALRPVISARSRVTIAQPKAVALAAAAGISAGIIVDLEPTSIAVIIVRTGLAEVVRDVAISPELRPPQVAQILAGQVNRSVGYYNARYPDDHLPQTTPIFVTGEGVVEPQAIDLALATLPYPRQSITCPFEAPEGFQPGVYAAALGTTRQEMLRRSGRKDPDMRPVFDFLPAEFKPRPLPVKKLIAASVAAVMLMGGVPAYQAFASVSSQVTVLESSVGRLEPQVRLRTLQLRKVAAVQERIKTTNQEIEKLVASERAVEGSDKAFSVTLAAIRQVVPQGVKLGEMDDDGGLVELAASAADPDELFAFVRALSTIEGFGDVRIKSIALSQSGVTASIKVTRDAALLSAVATATAVSAGQQEQ